MALYNSAAEVVRAPSTTRGAEARGVRPEVRWTLAFGAIFAYMFVEYSNLPAMFPILQPLQLGKVLVLLCALGFLTSAEMHSQRTKSLGIDFFLFLFLIGCSSSVVSADDQQSAWSALGDVFRWGMVYFLISRIVNTTWRFRIFIFVLLLLNLKMAQFAVRSYFSELSYGRTAEFVSKRGVGAGTTSFFGNAGDFGVAMCVVWPLAGSLLFGETKRLSKYFLWACFVAYFAAILLCGSRGAVVGAAASALFAWARNPRRIGGALMVLFVVLGTYYFLPGANKERMGSALHWEADETARLRLELWTAGLHMFEDHPVLGVGLANFPASFVTNYWESSTRVSYAAAAWVPHSIYIEALSELGVAGSLPLAAILFLLFRLNARTRKHLKTLGLASRKNFEYRLAWGLDFALVGYLVSGAFLTVLYYPHLWFLLGLSVALYNICLRKQPEVSVAPVENAARKFAPAIC